MCDHDIEARRARDLERYHRRVAQRRGAGPLPEVREAPAPRPIAASASRASRSAGAPTWPAITGAPPSEPSRVFARSAGNSRPRPGAACAVRAPRNPTAPAGPATRGSGRPGCREGTGNGPGPTSASAPAARPASAAPPDCACTAGRRRARERTRYAKAKAEGKLYGGRKVETRRRIGRARSRRRDEARCAAGLCTGCGRHPPVEGGASCASCREARRAAERALYASRRAAGLCGSCGGPTTAGGSRCAPCAVAETARYPRKNAARREAYARRKAEGRCTDCGEPSQGAARCEPCARRSWERSAYFRAMPVFDPQFTVVDLETGDEHGPYDSWEDVALAMAFARLPPDRVEVITDAPLISRYAAWE